MIIASMIILIVVSIIVSNPEVTMAWIPLIEGIAISVFLLYIGYKTGGYRFYILSLLAIFLGAGLSIAGIGNLLGMGIFFFVIGLVMLASGVITLFQYLHHTQLLGENNDD